MQNFTGVAIPPCSPTLCFCSNSSQYAIIGLKRRALIKKKKKKKKQIINLKISFMF